jgi:hypothetical protein
MFVSSDIRGEDAPKAGSIAGSNDEPAQLTSVETDWTLEGTLKVHPKFLYKHYLADFGAGQSCALLGLEKFKEVKPGSRVEVTGELHTRFHSGGTRENPSPFPKTWIIYVDVATMKVARKPQLPGPRPKAHPSK